MLFFIYLFRIRDEVEGRVGGVEGLFGDIYYFFFLMMVVVGFLNVGCEIWERVGIGYRV